MYTYVYITICEMYTFTCMYTCIYIHIYVYNICAHHKSFKCIEPTGLVSNTFTVGKWNPIVSVYLCCGKRSRKPGEAKQPSDA